MEHITQDSTVKATLLLHQYSSTKPLLGLVTTDLHAFHATFGDVCR
jgi:hypothetical protein